MNAINETGLNYNAEIDLYIAELEQLKININKIPDVRTLQEIKTKFNLLTSSNRRKKIESKYEVFYNEVTLDLERKVREM